MTTNHAAFLIGVRGIDRGAAVPCDRIEDRAVRRVRDATNNPPGSRFATYPRVDSCVRVRSVLAVASTTTLIHVSIGQAVRRRDEG